MVDTNWEGLLAEEAWVAELRDAESRSQRALQLADEFHGATIEDEASATPILARLIGRLGADVSVRPPVYVERGEGITIGAGTTISHGLVALDGAPITIGEDCRIGPNVQLLTLEFPLDPVLRRAGLEFARPIAIGDNVAIGGGAIVLPGVTIGDNSVIGAGAVVTRDIPANVIAYGNPARVVRALP